MHQAHLWVFMCCLLFSIFNEGIHLTYCDSCNRHGRSLWLYCWCLRFNLRLPTLECWPSYAMENMTLWTFSIANSGCWAVTAEETPFASHFNLIATLKVIWTVSEWMYLVVYCATKQVIVLSVAHDLAGITCMFRCPSVQLFLCVICAVSAARSLLSGQFFPLAGSLSLSIVTIGVLSSQPCVDRVLSLARISRLCQFHALSTCSPCIYSLWMISVP